jgi:uncharacterized protein
VKVILDTNVLLSGFYFGGVPGQILEAWSAGKIVPVLSPSILSEYLEAAIELESKYGPTHFESFVSLLLVHAEVVDAPASLPAQVCTDSHDDKFLACALASSAKVIVTGDGALLAVNGWSGIEIIKPRTFVDRYLRDTT